MAKETTTDRVKTEIARNKFELEKAGERLLESYFTELRNQYQASGEMRRATLLNGLEKLAGVNTDRELSSKNTNQKFDGEIAKQIRNDLGLTLRELSEILGIENAVTQISDYENGKRKILNSSRGKTARKYLQFLKEHSYNPYNL